MNRIQQRQLALYNHFRDRRMTIAALIRFNWRLHAVLLILGIATIWAMAVLAAPFFAWIFAAANVAVIVRDLGYYRRSSRTWPMVREVLDWQKIAALSHDTNMAGSQ